MSIASSNSQNRIDVRDESEAFGSFYQEQLENIRYENKFENRNEPRKYFHVADCDTFTAAKCIRAYIYVESTSCIDNFPSTWHVYIYDLNFHHRYNYIRCLSI